MIIVNNQLPTSTLLEIKISNEITDDNGIFGVVEDIDIQETDEYLQFFFKLDSGAQIAVRKLKQVC